MDVDDIVHSINFWFVFREIPQRGTFRNVFLDGIWIEIVDADGVVVGQHIRWSAIKSLADADVDSIASILVSKI